MRKVTALFLSFFLFLTVKSQSLKKYDISNTGCTVYMFCDPGKFDEDYSGDSSRVYTAECTKDDLTYGVICVKLLTPISAMNEAEDMLVSYLDYLKVSFSIKGAAGYGKGHRLKDREDTRGIIDYWTDNEKNNWKVIGWTDGKFIAVLTVYSKKELPEIKIDVYLNSFRLPGM